MAIETGVNVSSVQQELSKDYFGTLERVAEAGYKNIELVGYNIKSYTRYIDELPVELVKEKLAQFDLSVISTQEVSRSDLPLESHDWDSVCSYYEQLNCHKIVIPSVWMLNREDALRTADQMNRVGRRMRENGFTFYHHNHAHEFKRDGDQTLYDYLIDNTDPDYVRFELDLGWVVRAGLQPIDVLAKLGNRCDIVHLKDISHTPKFPINLFDALRQDGNKPFDSFMIYRDYATPEDYADLGKGSYDLVETFKWIQEKGHVRYAMVENIGASEDKFKSLADDLHVVKQYL
ncbi:sugar phosphate isomerase/epimerase [Paenibacillus sp. LjRoot153]|uniref:sugar phosphate isomerase/epimerase family protein n=1 Tax=Paenibacillus sp. LjRoot153 TaxID=3342270 RepID=UPI003ECCFBD5